jgi:hypothetical protein
MSDQEQGPDVAFSAQLKRAGFTTSLRAIENDVARFGDKVATIQAKIAQKQKQLDDAATDRQKANAQLRLDILKLQLTQHEQLYSKALGLQTLYYTKMLTVGQNAFQKLNTANKQNLQQMTQQWSGFQKALTSFGFGLLGAGRAIPGARLASALSIGYGFGGAPGLVGAASAGGIAAIVEAGKKLVDLYEELAKKAFMLTSYHDTLNQSWFRLKETASVGLVPLLTQVQQQELKFFEAIDRNRDTIGTAIEDFSKLASSVAGVAEKLLLIATNSDNIEQAIGKIAKAVHNAGEESWSGLIGKLMTMGPGGLAAYEFGKFYHSAAPTRIQGPPPLSQLDSQIPQIPSIGATPARGTVSNLREAELLRASLVNNPQENALLEAKVGYLREEQRLRQQSLLLQTGQASLSAEEINRQETQLRVRQEYVDEQLKSFDAARAEADALIKSYEKIYDLKLKPTREAAEVEIERAKLELLKQEYETRMQIFRIEREAIDQQGFLESKKAQGLYDIIGQTPLAQNEADIKFEQAVRARQAKIDQLEAAVKEANDIAAAEQKIVDRLKGVNISGSKYSDEYLAAQKKRDEARQNIAKAENNLAEYRIQSENEIAKIRLDNEAAIEAAKKKDYDDQQKEEFNLFKFRQDRIDENFKRESELADELARKTGRDYYSQISKIVSTGTLHNPSDVFAPPTISPKVFELLRILNKQRNVDVLTSQTKNAEADKENLKIQLAQAKTEEKRVELRKQIVQTNREEVQLNQLLITALQQLQQELDPASEEWQNIEDAIAEIINKSQKLNDVSITWADKLVNTMEILSGEMSDFNAVIGKTAGNVGKLFRTLIDLRKVKLPADQGGEAAGSITGGLKAAFGSASSIITTGIPLAGAIASSVIGIASTIKGLFERAAKRIGEAIGKEVDKIDADVRRSGKLQDGIIQLEAERNKAVSELSHRKGGQKQLDELLPRIDDSIANLKDQQKQIVDSFKQELYLMNLQNDELADVVKSWDTINDKVQTYINAAGTSSGTFDDAFQYVAASAAKMTGDIDKQIADLYDQFYKGAENERGELISIAEQAANQIADTDQKLSDTLASIEKQRSDATKQFNEEEQSDLEKIADLKQQIIDLDNEMLQGIKDIQNEGIAERAKTTQQDKAQRIADLQDKTQKDKDAAQKEIDNIQKQRAERYLAFVDQMNQLDAAETQAQIDHDNTIARIINEGRRREEEIGKRLADLQLIKDKIQEEADAENQRIQASLDAWNAYWEARKSQYDDYNNYINTNTSPYMPDQLDFLTSGNNQTVNQSKVEVGSLSITISGQSTVTKEDVQEVVTKQLDYLARKVAVK